MDQEKERTVREFVEHNQVIIFMIGVFGALIEFANSSVKVPKIAHYISFCLLILMQMLFYELIKDFKGKKTDSLYFFLSVLFMLDFHIFTYWLIDNIDILYMLRYHFFGFIVGMVVTYVLLKYFKIQKYFIKK